MRSALILLVAALWGSSGSDDATVVVPNEGVIAFSSKRDGDFDIYTMQPDGTGLRMLTRNRARGLNEADDYEPAWSPDGERLAFTSTRDHEGDGIAQQELYVMNADGSAQRRLTRNGSAEYAPTWLPDGRVLFVRCTGETLDCALVAHDVVTGREEKLHRVKGALFGGLDVSPDGSKVAYTREELGRVDADIYVFDLTSRDERRLTDAAASDGNPTWSRDGKRLAFVSDRDGNGDCLFHDCAGAKPELYVMDADGENELRVTKTDLEETGPTWSPDGRGIVVAQIADENDDYELVFVELEAGSARALTRNGHADWMPDWRP